MELGEFIENVATSISEVKSLMDSFEESDCLIEGEPTRGTVTSLEESFEYGDTPIVEEKKDGGSYDEVFQPGEGEAYEVHHMPANSTTELSLGDGPAIRMEKADHRQTASCGSSNDAKEYRDAQQELIDQGAFREALQMDIDDVRDKFGDKYDEPIAQLEEYVDKLDEEGRI